MIVNYIRFATLKIDMERIFTNVEEKFKAIDEKFKLQEQVTAYNRDESKREMIKAMYVTCFIKIVSIISILALVRFMK